MLSFRLFAGKLAISIQNENSDNNNNNNNIPLTSGRFVRLSSFAQATVEKALCVQSAMAPLDVRDQNNRRITTLKSACGELTEFVTLPTETQADFLYLFVVFFFFFSKPTKGKGNLFIIVIMYVDVDRAKWCAFAALRARQACQYEALGFLVVSPGDDCVIIN